MDEISERASPATIDNVYESQLSGYTTIASDLVGSMFTVGPSVMMICLTPFYLRQFTHQPIIAAEVLSTKLLTSAFLLLLQTLSAMLPSASDTTGDRVALHVLKCLATIALAAFIHFEHRHAPELSVLPRLYLSVTLLLDIIEAVSSLITNMSELWHFTYAISAIVPTKLLLVILCDCTERRQTESKCGRQNLPAGQWNLNSLSWVDSTISFGFRNYLSIDNLSNLGDEWSSATFATIFHRKWDKGNNSVVSALFWAHPWSLLAVIPSYLLLTAAKFAEPLVLSRALQQVGNIDNNVELLKEIVRSMSLLYLGLAVATAWYRYTKDQARMKARGGLVSQILRKSLTLGPNEAKRCDVTGLISNDVATIVNAVPLLQDMFGGIIQLAASVYLASAAVPTSLILIMIPAICIWALAIHVVKQLEPEMNVWRHKVEERVSVTSQFLLQLQGIKMVAAETAIGNYLQLLRKAEVGLITKSRRLGLWTSVALTLSYASTPIFVVAGGLFWGGYDNGLNAIEVFVTLALVWRASTPMAELILSGRSITRLLPCIGRVEAYLSRDEHVDNRLLPSSTQNLHPPYDIDRFPMQLSSAAISTPEGRILFTADICIERGSFVAAIGPSGAGKSTFLRSLIGEAHIASGHIFMQAQAIAYCDQEEWICNVTIRAVIIGENPYDESWYNTVASACLLRDLNEFPFGDLTLAGHRGSNLSSSQRQRLALARAAYIRAEVIILDDPLSAVDRQSSEAILSQLLGKDGLLRAINTTIVMSTHSVEMVRSADQVLVIQSNGALKMQSPERAIQKYEGRGFLDDFEDDDEDMSDEGSDEDSPARHYEPPQPREVASTQLRPTGSLALYWAYLSSFNAVTFIFWLLVAGALVFTERFPDAYIMHWVDRDPGIRSPFIGYSMFGVATALVNLAWARLYFMHLVPQSAERFHRKLLSSVSQYVKNFASRRSALLAVLTLHSATLSFLSYSDPATLLNGFNAEMTVIVQDLPLNFFYFLYDLISAIFCSCLIFSTIQGAIFLAPLLIATLLISQLYYLRASKQLQLLEEEAAEAMKTHLNECSEGIAHIRAFRWEEQYLYKGLDLLDKSQKVFYYKACLTRWLFFMTDLIIGSTCVVIVILGLKNDSVTQAAVALCLILSRRVGDCVDTLPENWFEVEKALEAVSRIQKLIRNTPHEVEPDTLASMTEDWPQSGSIRMENIDADHITDDGEFRALHEISVEIDAGSKVAIVGSSGSGKSTFLMTLLNFLRFSGSITIDGVDITTIPRHTLRSRITTISQEFLDFPGSVRDNLVPQQILMAKRDRLNDRLLTSALEKVGLLKAIKRAAGGIVDLDVNLDDVGLSADQQQLFALARALIHHQRTNGKLVFIDETTSYIDQDCEEKMSQVIDEAFADCTVLTVAHRNYTLQTATNFLELSDGELVSYE